MCYIKDTSNGRIAVAILWTVDFDPGDVDPSSILLEGVSPLRWSLNKDVSGDGEEDLVLRYSVRELYEVVPPVLVDENWLTLAGHTFDGRNVEGMDQIFLAGGDYYNGISEQKFWL